MKLFIDECLSPQLAQRVNEAGDHFATHARDLGGLRRPDHQWLRHCVDNDLTIVTENAVDFRKLVGRESLHPGLIILPSVSRERSWTLLQAALTFLAEQGDPAAVMTNQVLEIDVDKNCKLYALPEA